MGEPSERRGSRFWRWLGVVIIIYLVPAVVLLLDGAFFSSHLWRALTPDEQHAVNALYWPIGQVFHHVHW